jgi:hypothetical protein
LCQAAKRWHCAVGQLAQNRCYTLAAVYYTETLIEAVKKKNLKNERGKRKNKCIELV